MKYLLVITAALFITGCATAPDTNDATIKSYGALPVQYTSAGLPKIRTQNMIVWANGAPPPVRKICKDGNIVYSCN